MEKFIDKIGTKYVVQKIKETVRVMSCDNLEELQVGQMACVPDINYQDEYLTLSALEDGEITITIPSQVNSTYATSLSYSKDKSSWVETVVDDTSQTITIPVSAGDDVYLKGVAQQWSTFSTNTSITSDCNIIASGNTMSLLYEDDFKDKKAFLVGSQYVFRELFSGNTHLINAEDLILPATTLTAYACYAGMFFGCTELITAPELPATVAQGECYSSMFQNCTSLTTAPELPATTLAPYCYSSMFKNCTALTTAPALPTTTLAAYCYQLMFQGCTSLTTAPELPATTLTSRCYMAIFNGCTSLTTAPELPATVLADRCYYEMFQGCTALTTAPTLPATTLASNCYYQMFFNCSKLNSITMLATDISATNCLNDWVINVAPTGTFTKAASMTTLPTGTSGIPSGWTVIDK